MPSNIKEAHIFKNMYKVTSPMQNSSHYRIHIKLLAYHNKLLKGIEHKSQTKLLETIYWDGNIFLEMLRSNTYQINAFNWHINGRYTLSDIHHVFCSKQT